MDNLFFDNWMSLARVLIIGVLAYVAVIFWLRLFGKRTLAKWNAFDFIVTIAFGSTLASVLLSKNIALAEGVFAFFLLAGLQFLVTWVALRVPFVQKLVKSEPSLLFYRGEFLNDVMLKQRVAEEEVRAAIRTSGYGAIEDIEAVVLETNGNFSVIKKSDNSSNSALSDVAYFDKISSRRQSNQVD